MMSSSRSLAAARSDNPCFTYTWQVEQAQTPPHADPTCACARFDASKIDVPTGTSISIPSGSNLTLGMGSPYSSVGMPGVRVAMARAAHPGLQIVLGLGLGDFGFDLGHAAAAQPGLERAVHAPPRELLGRRIELLDRRADRVVVGSGIDPIELAHRRRNGLLVLVGQQLGAVGHRRARRRSDALGLDPLLGEQARLD